MKKINRVWVKLLLASLLAMPQGLVIALEDELKTDEARSQNEWVLDTELAQEPITAAQALESNQVDEISAADLAPKEGSKTQLERQIEAIQNTPESKLLSQQLQQQLAKLKNTQRTRDAYSLELGEDYFGYGKLLFENGQADEAIAMFTNALHIQKVNHGLQAVEQRPALRELFNIYYSQGNAEEFENTLERIMSIESQNRDLQDDFSFGMLLTVGNDYIDRFMQKPFATQSSVENLLRAKRHLTNALRLHKNKPLSKLLMPYGELALISVLESRIQGSVEGVTSIQDSRFRQPQGTKGQFAVASYLGNSYARGMSALTGYLRKAHREQDKEHQIKALLALGDYNLMLERPTRGQSFYQAALELTASLDEGHSLSTVFNEPLALPAFEYASDRRNLPSTRSHVDIPLVLSVSPGGRVIGVSDSETVELNEEYQTYLGRAHRAARRLKFRPKYEQGKFVQVDKLEFATRVYKKQTDLQAEAKKTQ